MLIEIAGKQLQKLIGKVTHVTHYSKWSFNGQLLDLIGIFINVMKILGKKTPEIMTENKCKLLNLGITNGVNRGKGYIQLYSGPLEKGAAVEFKLTVTNHQIVKMQKLF